MLFFVVNSKVGKLRQAILFTYLLILVILKVFHKFGSHFKGNPVNFTSSMKYVKILIPIIDFRYAIIQTECWTLTVTAL